MTTDNNDEIPGYIARAEMAEMLKCSLDNVRIMLRDGRINLPELRVSRNRHQGGALLRIYPRAMFMELFEKGIPIKRLKVKKLPREESGVTFRKVLAGAFSAQHEKDSFMMKRMAARTTQPKTTTVRIRAASL
jgi:hypothetical protein